MGRKNNYPPNRKPAKTKKCPICGQTFKARGIINHLRQSHGIDYIEKAGVAGEAHTAFIKEPSGIAKSLDETISDLLDQLETARRNAQTFDYSVIVTEIAKVRETMGWSPEDMIEESDQYLSGSYGRRAQQTVSRERKRLVVMFEDNSYRPINITDYEEVAHWITELQDIKDDFKARIQRYKDVPALLKIEKELMGL